MKTIITIALCLLYATSSFAAGDAARVAGDLRVDGIVFNLDSSNMQTKASPWSFSGANIYYNGGNIGIGGVPSSPLFKLDVMGTVRATNTNNSVALYGINTSVDYPTLELIQNAGGSLIRGWSGVSPVLKFDLSTAGDAYFAGTVTATNVAAPSDIRLKTNIKTLESSLDKLLRLRGISYVMKADETNSAKIGVIAQELEKEYPELVLTNDKGMKSVIYANLTPVLIEAVKSLKLENDVLKKRLERIEKILADNKP